MNRRLPCWLGLSVFALAAIFVTAAFGAYGQQPDASRCIFACVTVSQIVSNEVQERIELTCRERPRLCHGQGFFQMDGERIPVSIGALVWPDKISMGVKSGNHTFVSREGETLVEIVPLGGKQSKEYILEGMPERWATQKDEQLLTPTYPVVRKGVRLSGFIRIEYEKSAVQ